MNIKLTEGLALVLESETAIDEWLINEVLAKRRLEFNGVGFVNAGFSFAQGGRSHISYVWIEPTGMATLPDIK